MTTIRGPGAIAYVASVLLVGAVGCKSKGGVGEGDAGPTGPKGPEVSITPEARAEAESIFATRCTPCHGATGSGDGPTAKRLSPPPRDFHDPAWQASATDPRIEETIRFGGAAVGKSPGMPGNPDLLEKPEVVAALREHVRKLATAK